MDMGRTHVRSTRVALAIAALVSMAAAATLTTIALLRNDGGADAGQEVAADFALAIGAAALAAILSWLVLHFLYVRRIAPDRGGVHLPVLVSVSLMATMGPFAVSAVHTLRNLPPRQTLTQAVVNHRPPTSIAAIVDEFHETSERERAAAEVARRDVLGAGLVQAYNLGRPDSVERLRTQLAELRLSTGDALARQDLLMVELESRIQSSVAPSQREAASQWLEVERNLRARRFGALRHWFDAQFNETEAMIHLLEQTEGHWRNEHGRLAFDRDADLEAMNRHAARLLTIGHEIDQIEIQFEREAAERQDRRED